MSKTNFEAITKNAQELGRFLRSLPILEAPWDTEFQKRYCSGCTAENCGVCGYRVTPKKEEIYVAEEPRGFMDALTKPQIRFSAMDCPRCGCQIALAVRFPRVDLPEVTERDGADESEVADNA